MHWHQDLQFSHPTSPSPAAGRDSHRVFSDPRVPPSSHIHPREKASFFFPWRRPCSPNGNPRMEDPRGAEGARAKAAADTPADGAIRPSALSTRSLSFLQIIYVYEPPPLLSGAMMMRQTTCRARPTPSPPLTSFLLRVAWHRR